MKTTLKISAIILTIAGFSFGAKAQTTSTSTSKTSTTSADGIIWSIGVDAGLPTGKLKDNYNWSLGSSVQADIPIVAHSLYVTVNAGYDNGARKK